ncbi:MAG: ABC transporter ATP-binding protein [Candidatus Jettenia sp.]|uniref:ABC transporter ATP-binding component n=1 Tax=Candidatus Jettenia caeni TaxID=247490 RepID=I3IMD5_9BACT|nr:ABC transporter ATP-binding protein [Candidatus Jettenia sp. AMX1]MBC6927759.1 ABC transporter ATP-binding protein [Candidatus Jettenia sp.]NUN21954.1 ABC transporter ATP-binding protein [Candidatus Jettenia caeni]KAA0251442.1 MAG: ABC transporter ATP-binding protein [Candidatus Jettenia sp. AMX1]MCE7879425.1 ABC transporter ATP-binding protein [Candidatus Jettenia sp. AMX1]MDL1938374.1 ABC transporter ATP-binding protein [Candidatus Jettenia sp. AMX1]
MIKTEHLSKYYSSHFHHEVRAIRDITLEITKKSFVIFKGPSGSGKTTLLNVIGTLDRPTEGKVFMYGEDITTFSDIALSRLRREKIGFIFQDFHLIPRLTSWENVSYPLIPLGVDTKKRFERARLLLEKVELGDRLDHTPEELSGGQQQRVAIARALINDPEIIIADEPTSNIDEETGEHMLELLTELKNNGVTILVATHDARFEKIADRVFKLKNGKIE